MIMIALKLSQNIVFFIKYVLTLPPTFSMTPHDEKHLLHKQYPCLHRHNLEEQMLLFGVN